LILIIQVIVNLVLAFVVLGVLSRFVDDDEALFVWSAAVLGLVAFAFFWGYYIFFEMIWNGQSPGKRWVGLRVIRTNGTPITLTESIIRNLVRLIDFLPFYYGLGVVTMFINEQSRRLGDLAAGTLVVWDRPAIALESLGIASRPATPTRNISPRVAALPVERLSEQDLRLVEEFFRRRHDLATRADLAQRLLRQLYEQMGLEPPQLDPLLAEDLLAEIVQFHRQRNAT
jgi:uncharacterized RDD family membrane protein YckC